MMPMKGSAGVEVQAAGTVLSRFVEIAVPSSLSCRTLTSLTCPATRRRPAKRVSNKEVAKWFQ